VIRVLGSFASGIAVVTGYDDGLPHALTCQSLASLSLDPPLISLNIGRQSQSWPKIRRSGVFAVNVLAHDQKELCRKFSRSGTDKFADVEWSFSTNGLPTVKGRLALVECRLWAEYDGGDHTIVAGQVLALESDEDSEPLLFYRGGFVEEIGSRGRD
jgi:3-hydroxy-9,10-secoandrosta-1,3,5(10)-triene-9,17-dione monooxygenase reductase component